MSRAVTFSVTADRPAELTAFTTEQYFSHRAMTHSPRILYETNVNPKQFSPIVGGSNRHG